MAGDLDAPAAAQCDEHLAVCGLCAELLERLRDFDLAAATMVAEPDWLPAERRISEACRQRLEGQRGRTQGIGGWLKSLSLLPALASTLVLGLAYPAWLGFRDMTQRPAVLRPAPAVQVFPAAAAQVVDLNTVREQQSLPVIDGPEGQRVVALLFFVPVTLEARPRAEIRSEAGELVLNLEAIASYDRNGNFCVVAETNAWKSGQYRLVVYPDAKGPRSGRTYSFPFVRR